MFCSKCGKTIRPEDTICSGCHAPIGNNRFGGIPYTSAQFTIAPGQTSFEPLNAYTRTTYTSNDVAQSGEADTRTTYRPVYEGASAPEDVRRDMRAAVAEDQKEEEAPARPPEGLPENISAAAQETLEEVDNELKMDDEIDMSQFRSRPIQSSGRAGISRDVSEYIQKLEDTQTRKGPRHRREGEQADYDDYGESASPVADYEGNQDGYAEDDGDYIDARHGSRFSLGQLLKIVIALVIVAAIVVGAVLFLRNLRTSTANTTIEGVTEQLYTDGLALVKGYTESDYVNNMISKYTNDGVLTMAAQLESDASAIDTLTPASPGANDSLFISALKTIQANIGNAITMDAISVGSASATATQDSEARWTIVNNSITALENAKTTDDLTAVVNGQTITVQSATPEPTAEPTVTYVSLQKGDKSNDVLNLQVRLYELGYLNDDRDGNFGAKTQTAVKLFQQTMGLEATGIADNATQTALYAEDAPAYSLGTEGAATEPTAQATDTAALEATATPEPDTIQPAEAGNGLLAA